jgi:hypothetical protein
MQGPRMEVSSRTAMVTAVIAAVAATTSAVVSYVGTRDIRRLEARQALERQGAEFIAERLTKLYVPVTMHLAATKVLFTRYFEASTTAQEKVAIEHELRFHNKEIRERLMQWSVYVESRPKECGSELAPDDLMRQLLGHLIQWETVYRLKYEYKVYEGPVFTGIKDFGFRGFPEGADEYFQCTERVLREQMHARSKLALQSRQ